jgi:SulP family sulfate permease
MIALLEAKQAGLLGRANWPRNIIAGLIVGVVALPLAMAFAIASGAKPEQGLYTAIVAGLMTASFGGTRAQISGPTGAFIVILAGISGTYGIEGLQIATLMAGIILVLFGVARLGSIIKFIPDPVIAGFTAGIGVIIWVGQWKDFFGLRVSPTGHFHEKLLALIQALPHLHPATTGLAAMSLLVLIVGPRIPVIKRVPGPLLALLIASGVQAAFKFDGVATIGTAFGGIPRGLPPFHIPDLSFSRIVELVGPAFTVAMLGAIESLLSAVVADGMAGTKHDSNQELIGQGLANIASPLFGGFAATGAIARTATNIRNGANSPLAGIVHTITLVFVLLIFAPLAVNIPLAVLAAILFVVAWNMSEARHFVRMARRAPPADVVILLVTFSLTVFVDLVVAVNIGVILATLHFLRRMSASVTLQQHTDQELREEFELTPAKGVMVYSLEGPFFFGAAENFERALASSHTDPKIVILRLKRVPFIDMTGLQTLEEVISDLKRRHVRVVITEANERVHGKMQRAGVLDLVGTENYFPEVGSALRAVQPPD